MSYRTVDKHLEHIYAKIGVESRSSATAASARILAD
jgi:DNA-binding CsgD family transcriptional regulator